jgi:hypothetical protein
MALRHLTEKVQQHRDPKYRILDQLGLVVIRVTNLCADVKSKSIRDPAEIIRTAMSIDAELISLMISAPPPWRYKTIKVPVVDGRPIISAVWGDSYHVYQSLAATNTWNNYRSARIVIQELILDTLKDLDGSVQNGFGCPQADLLENQCRQTMTQMGQDICASVPFSLGWELEQVTEFDAHGLEVTGVTSPPLMSRTASTEACMTPENEASRTPSTTPGSTRSASMQSLLACRPASFDITGAGGLSLMWPLLVAANSGVASDDLRGWIIGCLEKIGHGMGINQPLSMARLLKDRMRSRAWLTPGYGTPSPGV